MHRLLALILVPTLLSGCNIYSEILTPRITPNGKLTANIDGGTTYSSTGLGTALKERFELNGFSAALTFGLVAGEDATGRGSKAVLAEANTAIDLIITPVTATRLQVHLGGSGCIADDGLIHLRSDKDKHIDGEYSATGHVPASDPPIPCELNGKLERIPVER